MDCETLRVAGIVNDSITDGPGLRFALFVQGCPHHCPQCHNSRTWPFEGGEIMSVEEVFLRIIKNPLIEAVTFTGGEPMCQAAALCRLGQLLKLRNIDLAVYTGYTFEELIKEQDKDRLGLLSLTDVLVDGPFIQEEKSLSIAFRGSKNQRLLDAQASLAAGRAVWTHNRRWTGESGYGTE